MSSICDGDIEAELMVFQGHGSIAYAAVDRLLDMLRTAVNVWGDACGATVVARLEGETLN